MAVHGLDEKRQRCPHGRGGHQEQAEAHAEAAGVEKPWGFAQRSEPGGHCAAEQRQQEYQCKAGSCDRHFEQRVESHGTRDACPEAQDDSVAQGEARHETRENHGRGPDAVSECEACLLKPESLEEKSRSPGHEEDGRENRRSGHRRKSTELFPAFDL